jgi:hypothetical protein
MLMLSVLQLKEIDWWVVLQNKTGPFFSTRNAPHWQRPRLRGKRWKKILQTMGSKGVATLISDKIDFKQKLFWRDNKKVTSYG